MLRLLMLMLMLLGWILVNASPARANTFVVLQTVLGPIEVELFDAVTPSTVTNFLFYADTNAYDQSFIHRSVPEFVIQGGGYKVSANQIVTVAANPPTVANEPGLSNLRGTIAMAKLGGQPDSATTQWFINVGDNTGLDTSNGGFTVFGEVISGLANADAINALTIVNAGIPFNELPVVGWTVGNPVTTANLVMISDVTRQTASQCGDLNADALIDEVDVARLRAHLANPLGSPLSAGELSRCSVIGSATGCDLADSTVLRRRLAGRKPLRQQVCPAAS